MLTTAIFAIQIVLAVMFTVSASMKWLQTGSMVQHWREYRYPMWFMSAIAALETAGVLAMIAGIWFPRLAVYAAALFVVLMFGAVHAHLVRARHRPVMASNAILMLALSIVIIALK